MSSGNEHDNDDLPEHAKKDQPETGEILEVDQELEGTLGDQHVWEGK